MLKAEYIISYLCICT